MARRPRLFVLLPAIAVSFTCTVEPTNPAQGDTGENLFDRLIRTPSGLQINEVDSSFVRLAWNDESIDEEHHRLEMRADSGDFSTILLIPANADSVTFYGNFESSHSYSFRLRSERGERVSPYTEPVHIVHENAFFITTVEYGVSSSKGTVVKVSEVGLETLASQTSAGISSPFNDIAAWGRKVLVVGSFSQIGGKSFQHAAVWDEGEWEQAGSGIGHIEPTRIAIVDGVPFVGTSFNGSNPTGLYRWDGSQFVSFHPASPAVYAPATSSAATSTVGYFCYRFGQTRGIPPEPIAVLGFDATGLLPIPQPGVVQLEDHFRNGIAALGNDVYLALSHRTYNDEEPDTTLLRYSGSQWQIVDISGRLRSLTAIAAFNGILYGSYEDLDSSGNISSTFGMWNGASWVDIRRMSSTRIYTVVDGLAIERISPDGTARAIEFWDGMTWTQLISFPGAVYTTGVSQQRGWVWRQRF